MFWVQAVVKTKRVGYKVFARLTLPSCTAVIMASVGAKSDLLNVLGDVKARVQEGIGLGRGQGQGCKIEGLKSRSLGYGLRPAAQVVAKGPSVALQKLEGWLRGWLAPNCDPSTKILVPTPNTNLQCLHLEIPITL